VKSAGTTLYRWEDLPKERLKPDLQRRLISTERLMLAHVYLEKGCVVPLHSHENEQLTYILVVSSVSRSETTRRRSSMSRQAKCSTFLPRSPSGGGTRDDARRRHLLSPTAGLARRSDAYLRRT